MSLNLLQVRLSFTNGELTAQRDLVLCAWLSVDETISHLVTVLGSPNLQSATRPGPEYLIAENYHLVFEESDLVLPMELAIGEVAQENVCFSFFSFIFSPLSPLSFFSSPSLKRDCSRSTSTTALRNPSKIRLPRRRALARRRFSGIIRVTLAALYRVYCPATTRAI